MALSVVVLSHSPEYVHFFSLFFTLDIVNARRVLLESLHNVNIVKTSRRHNYGKGISCTFHLSQSSLYLVGGARLF